jgi:hypothetical protein
MKRTRLVCFFVLALTVSMGRSSAQSFNVDIDGTFGTPGSSFAAGGSAGVWNNVPVAPAAVPLVDLSGAATGVSIVSSFGPLFSFSFNNAGTTGDDEALLDDAQDSSPASTWVIANLAAGQYTVYTYAWAPDSAIYVTGVSVNNGPVHAVGGAWPGTYALGITHSVDDVILPAGGNIEIRLNTVVSFSTFNGVQIVRHAASQPLSTCFGDGSSFACPCVPNGAVGNGCPNSVSPLGANLIGAGANSITADTLVLSGSGMPPTSTCLYFQGTPQLTPGTLGDGLECVGANLIRLGIKTNVAGVSAFPSAGDPSISVRGGALVGNVIQYQTLYRDAASFCTSATFNVTNAVTVLWEP